MTTSFLLLNAFCARKLDIKKKIIPMLDSLEKHAKKKRNEYGQKIMDMKCAHAKMRFSMLQ
jgi:hypothetical protein